MGNAHDFGRATERLAALHLERAGWTVLCRNWRWHHKEIDLIARHGSLVAFVEVKARRRAAHGHPLETVTWSKRRDLEAAALAWIVRHGQSADEYRFDVIWVLRSEGGARIHHDAGAWGF